MTRPQKILLGYVFLLLLAVGLIFTRYMEYREEHTLSICISPPFPVGNCEDVVAVPGDRIALNGIARISETGPVVQNYWVKINGTQVPVEILENGHNGVEIYATVPEPEPFFHGRSALSREQQILQDCVNVSGQLYGLDEDADGYMTALANSTGDVNAYPCVVSGTLRGPYQAIFLMNVDRIGADRDDSDNTIH